MAPRRAARDSGGVISHGTRIARCGAAQAATSPGIAFAPDSTTGSGVNGPTFVLYGYQPNAVVSLSIRGAFTGASNNGRSQAVDEFGVYWSWLGTAWPADTYTFTVTSANGPTVTATFTKTN